MRFVKLADVIDPTDYLQALPRLKDGLPAGAWSFVSDPNHFDFYSPRCVKDLTLEAVELSEHESLSLILQLGANRWKHENGLTIRYRGVVKMAIELNDTKPVGRRRLGSVILDEVLPDDHGCSHEIAFTGGRVMVVCADLKAAWESRSGEPEG